MILRFFLANPRSKKKRSERIPFWVVLPKLALYVPRWRWKREPERVVWRCHVFVWPKRTQQVRSFLIFRKGNHPGFGENGVGLVDHRLRRKRMLPRLLRWFRKGMEVFHQSTWCCREMMSEGPTYTRMIQVDPTLGYVSQCFVPSKIASCSILQLTKKTRRFHFVHWLLIQGFLPQESEWWSPENAWAPKMHHHLFGQYRVPKKTEQFFQDVLDDMNISMNFQGSNFSTYSGVAIHKSLVIYLGLSGSVPLTLLLNYNISSWYSPFFVA